MTEENLIRLINLARQGDSYARQTAIEGNIIYARALAKRFARRHSHNMDGIYSEACVGLCEAIDYIINNEDCLNPLGIIANIIRYTITTFIAYDRTIKLSRSTFYKRLEQGNLHKNSIDVDVKHLRARISECEYFEQLENIYSSLYFSDTDKVILDYLLEGYKLNEIGSMIGMRHQAVGERCLRCGTMLRNFLNEGRLGYEF